jgi:ATP-binding cassette subfamily B multidrug efflux pump
MALATNDIDAIEMAAGEAMLAGFDGTLTLVMVLGVMLLGVDWRLALIALLPFPLMALAFWRISRHIHTAETDSLKRFSALNDHVQESLSGVRTLRALGLEARSAQQFSELAGGGRRQPDGAEMGSGLRAGGRPDPDRGQHPHPGPGRLPGLEQPAHHRRADQFHDVPRPADLADVRGRLGAVADRTRTRRPGAPAADAGRAAHGGRRRHTRPSSDGPLVLRDVRFAYGGAASTACARRRVGALRPGQTLGLVGPTGAGKSTLLRVLLRQADAAAWRVTWGGHPLTSYTLARCARPSAGCRRNPSCSRPASPRTSRSPARRQPRRDRTRGDMAAIHDDILRFPQGYDTPVGEKGITLSGGQRQRVAIARSLLAQSSLLLLDDALSAVDTGTETRILEHLAELRARGRSCPRSSPATACRPW